MRNKIFKIGVMSATILTSLFILSSVKADETSKSCTHYEDYFLFNAISSRKSYTDLVGNGKDFWTRRTGSYFPNINKVTIKMINESENGGKGRVCLKRSSDSKADGNDCLKEWTLDEYYTYYLNAINKDTGGSGTFLGPESVDPGLTTYSVTSTNKTETKNYSYYRVTTGDTVKTYYVHGKWYEFNEQSSEWEEKGTGVQLSNIPKKDLIDNSVLTGLGSNDKSYTTINVDYERSTSALYLFGDITRSFVEEDFSSLTGFDFKWSSEIAKTLLAPAVYFAEYDICTDAKPKYNADIQYWCEYEDNKREECYDPHKENNLDDGYTHEVTSPKIEGCVPDKSKVDIKISGSDFHEDVVYKCSISEAPKLGDALIYFAWIIGIISLGYSIYYFSNSKKAKSE